MGKSPLIIWIVLLLGMQAPAVWTVQSMTTTPVPGAAPWNHEWARRQHRTPTPTMTPTPQWTCTPDPVATATPTPPPSFNWNTLRPGEPRPTPTPAHWWGNL